MRCLPALAASTNAATRAFATAILCDIGAFELITLLIQPMYLSFGSEPVGQQTPAQKLTLTNNQTTSVRLGKSIGGKNPADFIIVSTTCGGSLASHASCTISLAFRPKRPAPAAPC
jgi:hypothetical protein